MPAGQFRRFRAVFVLTYSRQGIIIRDGCRPPVSYTHLRNESVARLGPGQTGSFASVCTLVSVIAGVVLLKESFSFIQGIGTALVLVGVYRANTLPKGARQVSFSPPPGNGPKE